MTTIRSCLASLLLAVLAVGGVALPSAHAVAHGLETQAERTAHQALAHGGDGDHAQTPCAPSPNSVDCAICAGLSSAADLAQAQRPAPSDPAEAVSAYADWTQAITAAGAGARAPPVS